MKEIYEKAKTEIYELDLADVITTSGEQDATQPFTYEEDELPFVPVH